MSPWTVLDHVAVELAAAGADALRRILGDSGYVTLRIEQAFMKERVFGQPESAPNLSARTWALLLRNGIDAGEGDIGFVHRLRAALR